MHFCVNQLMVLVLLCPVHSNSCGLQEKFDDLKIHILEATPSATVTSTFGRTGSFEVKINDVLVHSKLSTLALPDFKNVAEVVYDVSNGGSVRKIEKQQPINDCCLQ